MRSTHRSPLAAAGLMLGMVVVGTIHLLSVHAATVTYQPDTSDFPNPERGFWQQAGDPNVARAQNITLMHQYFRLDDFKSSPLTPAYLNSVDATFASARAAGIKVVPRFTYNFPATYPINPAVDGDASLSTILGHIDQLAPILQRNSDVIAFMEAGFIGAWGEWHSSTNNLIDPTDKGTVLHKLLSVLPANRDVAVRYERDKKAISNRTTPISSSEAFGGTDIARTGHHNDCFLAAQDDYGTYDLDGTVPAQKAYLNQENLYVPQGGETCNSGTDAQPYIPCTNAMSDLAYQHWSALNKEYEPGVISLWQQQGCLTTISERLGYRFRLLQSDISPQIKPGGTFTASISLTNDGFASPYNPRGLELVLRNRSTHQEYVLPLSYDPRRWTAGATQNLAVTAGIPATMPEGTYDSFINLPDPAPALYARPEYAIRLANIGAWEASTGYNNLQTAVSIAASAGGATYTGSSQFKVKNGQPSPTPTPTPSATPTPTPTATPSPTPTATPGVQSPYPSAHSLPATVQAEDFDNGGQGVAYHDTDSINSADSLNTGGPYRTNGGVDIVQTNPGYRVGWTQPGEWLEYTVGVAQAGDYQVAVSVASAAGGGTFHVEVDGTNRTGALTMPNTGAWTTFQNIIAYLGTLTAGSHVVRLAFDSQDSRNTGFLGDVDALTFSLAGGTGSSGDTNGDGKINIFDLSFMLSKWSTADSQADLNGDGTVNVFDLSILISHWTG